MNIEPIHDGCLRVWLAEEELQHWGLSEEAPEPRQVRRLVRRIMGAAGRWPGRVNAELIPVAGGGVLLIRPKEGAESGQPLVFRLEDEEALLNLWEGWPEHEPVPYGALYAVEEAYWLAVYPDQPLSPRQMHRLLEYGTPLTGGEGTIAHAAEYGTLVAMGTLFTADGRRPPTP